jgi:6-phosphogluconolactonase
MIVERPFDDAAQMAKALAHDIAAHLREAVSARGEASFVATGGTTPAPLYRELALCDVPWAQVTVTLSDERWMSVDDPASNEGMLRRTLLTGKPSSARFVPLKTAAPRAADAETEVSRAISGMPLPFDVCLLGIGEDGHIASLFPGVPMSEDGYIQPVRALGAAGAEERLSLTMAAISQSRWICLLFTGSRKLAVYRAAQSGAYDTPLGLLMTKAAGRVSAYWCAGAGS